MFHGWKNKVIMNNTATYIRCKKRSAIIIKIMYDVGCESMKRLPTIIIMSNVIRLLLDTFRHILKTIFCYEIVRRILKFSKIFHYIFYMRTTFMSRYK